MKILIVDDSASTRSLLATLVNTKVKEKHSIIERESGEQALLSLDTDGIPDVCLFDVGLPGISGYDLCGLVRNKIGSPDRPYIIVITGNDDPEAVTQAIAAGANDYLAKPVNAKVLRTRLKVAQKIIQQSVSKEHDEYYKSLTVYSMFHSTAALAITDAAEPSLPFRVLFSNPAMQRLCQLTLGQISHQSLAAVQGWDPSITSLIHDSVRTDSLFQGCINVRINDRPIQITCCLAAIGDPAAPSHYLVIQH